MSTTPAVKQAPREHRMADRKGQWFTMGYKEAASQWWSSPAASVAERRVLNMIPYIKEATGSLADLRTPNTSDPYGSRVWQSCKVPLPGPGDRFLNEFSVKRMDDAAEDAESLVMLHGYGAGLGFFYKNFEPLSRVPGWRLFALDLLGMGNSARPPFKIHAKDQAGKVTEAENWFVDSLEEWRKARNINRFTFMAHSLGGYLAVSYSLKYPGRVKKLILVSPAGLPEDPYAVNEAKPEPTKSSIVEEFTQDQESIVHGKDNATDAHKLRPIPSWLVWFWDANFSPFTFIRLAGPFGPRVLSGWAERRFNHLPADESRTLQDYVYSVFRQKGSGEYALPYLLAPGAFARKPVIYNCHKIGRGVIRQAEEGVDGAKEVRENGIPIVMMYGEFDWMDVDGGLAIEEKLNRTREQLLEKASEEERRRDNGLAKVVVIPKAGHHLYLDNSDEFNAYVRNELEETRDYERRTRSS